MKKNLISFPTLKAFYTKSNGFGVEKNPNRSDLDALLDGLSSDFESSNFERMHADEKVAVIERAIKNRASKESNGMVKHIGQSGDNSGAIFSMVANSKGDLNLTVTRAGVAVNAPLPFVLFGSNDFQNGYFDTLKSLTSGLPAGTTVAVSTSTVGNIVFTYTDGMNVDTVTIENLGNISMKNFLTSMNNNFFSTKYFLVSISDEDQNLLQFAQPLFFGKLSALGMTQANQLVFRSRTNSWQYRKDRVEVVLPEQTIVPDFSFAMSIIKVDGFAMGFDFFMSGRKNLNNL